MKKIRQLIADLSAARALLEELQTARTKLAPKPRSESQVAQDRANHLIELRKDNLFACKLTHTDVDVATAILQAAEAELRLVMLLDQDH